jgi:L-rhamnose mutarotase
MSKLRQFLFANKMDSNALYQWHNHYVIYDRVIDIMLLEAKLHHSFPSMDVKVYHDMFFQFDKARDCADKSVAGEWDHIILTANLVANPRLQEEYLQYHATQFEKWPEVAKGFCNASFQQLCIFRNGRQLVLVISIPKGESLDRLNPLTTENNPRMDEWNRIMKKYQEGIDGTRKGETWVLLQPAKK